MNFSDSTPTDEASLSADAPSPAGAKADLGKRFVAIVIDAVVSALVGLIPWIGGIIATAYLLLRDGFDFDFMNGRSLGKHVMKLRPVTLDGSPMDFVASVKRNWMFGLGGLMSFLFWIPILGWILIIPIALASLALGIIELVLVITDPEGRRLGDRTGNTRVIEE